MAFPIATALQVFGNLASGAVNAGLQRETNEQNANLARMQNSWNYQMWQRANAYNSPFAQMQRLKAAGINPALAYSNGIENLGVEAPEMVSSQGHAPNIGSPFANLAQNTKQEQLTDSQIDVNKSIANRNNATAGLMTTQTEVAGVRLKILQKNGEAISDAQLDKLKADISYLQEVSSNIKQDTAIKVLEEKKLQYYVDNIQPAELEAIEAETGLKKAQTKELLYLMSYKALLMKAQANSANADARFKNANAEFQERLNSSDTYIQDVVNSMNYDAAGKLVSVSVDYAKDAPEFRAGYNDLYDYSVIKDPYSSPLPSSSDRRVVGFAKTLRTLGQMFSIIVKN